MDAVEYVKTLRRLCKSKVCRSGLVLDRYYAEKSEGEQLKEVSE